MLISDETPPFLLKDDLIAVCVVSETPGAAAKPFPHLPSFPDSLFFRFLSEKKRFPRDIDWIWHNKMP